MRVSGGWSDYALVDSTGGNRLERWGDVWLIRPDPQVIWNPAPDEKLWGKAHARYERSASGGGQWVNLKPMPSQWEIAYRDLRFSIRPTNFKHTGLFPEQAVNWDMMADIIASAGRPLRVLNLFAYTGGATAACLRSGASLCHVDASKGMISWARDNAALSGLSDAPVRWLVDDCLKFIAREARRGNKYDGIIMDPPSYGRGPGGEVWQLENQLYGLVKSAAELLSENAAFFFLNTYSTGLSAATMEAVLRLSLPQGDFSSDEIGLRQERGGIVLPCGSTAVWLGTGCKI